MISLGLIGCGAVVHANYAATLIGRDAYRVAYVCDTNSSQAASAAELFDAEILSLDSLVDKAEVIIISTPPATHSGLVRACLRPGRTILCEKPYMTTHKDAVEVGESAQELGALVYVGHFRRVFPQLALARKLIELGLIGDVQSFSASEGGRFTWKAVSSYTTRDPSGGVLWDTGSHTLDMALFAAGLDDERDPELVDLTIQRDRAEPSHDFRAEFKMLTSKHAVDGHLHLSRKEALPNVVRIAGSLGELTFVTDMDDRVRVTTPAGSLIIRADSSYQRILECFDLQLRRIFSGDGAEIFAAQHFVGQIKLLEALSNGE
jgi:predicted dehydrogenase